MLEIWWIAYMEFYDFEAVFQFVKYSLLLTIYFSDHYQSNPIIVWGAGEEKKGILTNTKKIPFTLILIEPNSSCFEFHNSRRVKPENNGASVFRQKAVIVLSILTGYQTSGCWFEE